MRYIYERGGEFDTALKPSPLHLIYVPEVSRRWATAVPFVAMVDLVTSIHRQG